MPREIALSACLFLILWLFNRDRKLRPMSSWALWIPLLWVMILGSRGSGYWLSLEVDPELASAAHLEGSPVDRNIYLSLIVSGTVALWRRRLNWGEIYNSNRWIFIFFIYCGVSIAWSDYSFVSFKGWVKDLGNIIMILIIITEADRVLAIKAVFARYIYFAIPLSVVMILYFPELSSYRTDVSDEIAYCGVTTNKNEFGEILVVCGLFLVHALIEKKLAIAKTDRTDLLLQVALFGTVIGLLSIANSSTAIGCLVLGTAILLLMRIPIVKKQVRYLGFYSLTLGMLFLFMNFFSGITSFLVEMLGRDMTFTGRTYIWENLLNERINPVFGTGFHSFWLPAGLMERYGYINQAHNGYLETYLNGGLIGASLLVAMIVSVGAKAKKAIIQNSAFGMLFLSIIAVGLIYNITEAMFNRLSLIWFVFLLASLEYHLLPKPTPEKMITDMNSQILKGRVRHQRTLGCLNG